MTVVLRNLTEPGWGYFGPSEAGVPASDIYPGGLLEMYRENDGDSVYRAEVTNAVSGAILDDFSAASFISAWVSVGSLTQLKDIGTQAVSGTKVMSLTQASTPQDQVYHYAVAGGQSIYVDFYVRANPSNVPGGDSNWLQILIRPFTSTGTPITTLTGISYMNQEDISTNWQIFSTASSTLTGLPYITPSGTAYVEITIRLQAAIGYSGEVWIDDFLISNTNDTFIVLNTGQVLYSTVPLVYNTYVDGQLDFEGLVYNAGWTTSPVIISRTASSFVLQGQTDSTATVYAILQKVGLSAPTFAQISAGTDSSDSPARGSAQVDASFTQPFTLEIFRNTGLDYPIYDVYVAVSATATPVSFTQQLLAPPAGKGYVIVGDLPAPEGSMLLQLPITVVNGDVIEYDLNSRPSSKVVTVLPNGVRSAV